MLLALFFGYYDYSFFPSERQLHWSTGNYAPLQKLALWGTGLVTMYEKVTTIHVYYYDYLLDVRT